MTNAEMDERHMVVKEAQKWVGTPYHSNADVLGHGVDCGMLLVRVFVDTGLVPPFDPRPYPADWHMHRDDERYLGELGLRAHVTWDLGPGDIILYRFGRSYSHGAIVTKMNPLTVVHAEMRAGQVMEDIVSKSSVLSDKTRRPTQFSIWPRT
jgi:cell wall-associated NlpC family hydrolase